jgi:Helicase associated domain
LLLLQQQQQQQEQQQQLPMLVLSINMLLMLPYQQLDNNNNCTNRIGTPLRPLEHHHHRQEYHQACWDNMYHELEQFRAQFGHAVSPKPQKDASYKSLRSWTSAQKREWKKFLNGDTSSRLNQTEIDKLDRRWSRYTTWTE